MYCSLCYCDTSHCREGYRMQIITETVYSTEWVDTSVAILKEHDPNPNPNPNPKLL
jgi:hypothetical protein